MLHELENSLIRKHIPFKPDEPMKNHTSFRIGGPCKLLIEPGNEEQIIDVIKTCKEAGIPYYVFGKGSNILVPDEGIDGAVIRLGGNFSEIEILDGNILRCEAGACLSKVCMSAMEHSLSGLEFGWGIPGSVGGAAYMNAGAYDGEMKNILLCCDHISSDGEPGRFEGEQLRLSYRQSVYRFHKGTCITRVYLRLVPGNKEAIKAKMDDFLNRRKEKQPLEFPSVGSTFKRPEGAYASALIDQCGLRGYSVGGAQVSEKHAGFVINRENATAKDVRELIKDIRRIVLEKTGRLLECEVEIIV